MLVKCDYETLGNRSSCWRRRRRWCYWRRRKRIEESISDQLFEVARLKMDENVNKKWERIQTEKKKKRLSRSENQKMEKRNSAFSFFFFFWLWRVLLKHAVRTNQTTKVWIKCACAVIDVQNWIDKENDYLKVNWWNINSIKSQKRTTEKEKKVAIDQKSAFKPNIKWSEHALKSPFKTHSFGAKQSNNNQNQI